MYKKESISGDAKFINSGYWIFFCNPRYWQIDEFLETEEVNSTWRIPEWQKAYFKKGQLAVVRVGNDTRTKVELAGKTRLQAGVYGIVEILSVAKLMPDSDSQFWLSKEKYEENRLRVKIRYRKKLLDAPILLDDLRSRAEFEKEKPLLGGRRVSCWSIRKEAFDAICKLADSHVTVVDEVVQSELNHFGDLQELEAKYFDATPRVKEVVSRRIERGTISSMVKKANNYECQICKALGFSPHGFKKKNGNFYVETHHIVPVSELEQGSLGTLNLLTVCANHHRQLHYGDVQMKENTDEYFRFAIDNKEIQIEKTRLL